MLKRFSLYLFFVFICGAAIGIFGYRFYELRHVSASAPGGRSPEEWKARHMKQLQERLHLEAGQMTRLDAIMNESRDRIHKEWERSKPEFDAIQRDQTAAVRQMLHSEQQPEYTRFLAEREKHRQQEQHKR